MEIYVFIRILELNKIKMVLFGALALNSNFFYFIFMNERLWRDESCIMYETVELNTFID